MRLDEINDEHLQAYLAGRMTVAQLGARMTGIEPYVIRDGQVVALTREELAEKNRARLEASLYAAAVRFGQQPPCAHATFTDAPAKGCRDCKGVAVVCGHPSRHGLAANSKRCTPEGCKFFEIAPGGTPAGSAGAVAAKVMPSVPSVPSSALRARRPLVSIVMNALNEGPRVRATVEAMRAAFGEPVEVIVVDDASTDGSCDDLPAGTIVLRNDERLGCGRSKVRAQSVARGDVLFFCDAHFSHIEGDLRSAVDEALREELIVACALRGIEYDAQWQARVVEGGGLMVPDARGIGVGIHELKYCPANGDRAPYEDRMVGGANVLASRRTLFERLGGWNRYRGKYGSQERGMAMRAYMAAVPIRVRPDLVLGHEFNKPSSASRPRWPYRPASMLDTAMATWHAYAAVVSAPTFLSAIVPLLMAHPQYRRAAGFENDAFLCADRELFARNCKRCPDTDLLRLLDAPTMPPDKGGATLGDDALVWVRKYARGRALEFGTGSGRGTDALLEACVEVVSIDDDEKYTTAARERIDSCRAEFVTAAKRPAGGYELAGKVTGLFDTLLLDGPAGSAARRGALASAWDYLAPGCVILVDDGTRDREIVEAWIADFPGLRGKLLPTARGLWCLRKAEM